MFEPRYKVCVQREALASWSAKASSLRDDVALLGTEVSAASSQLAGRRAENESYAAQLRDKERGEWQVFPDR
jgi:hypothetical protein